MATALMMDFTTIIYIIQCKNQISLYVYYKAS